MRRVLYASAVSLILLVTAAPAQAVSVGPLPASAQLKRPSLKVSTSGAVAGDTVRGKASQVRSSCQLIVSSRSALGGQQVKLRRRGSSATWAYVARAADSYVAELSCGKLKARAAFKVRADDPQDGPVDAPADPPVETPAPRLVGSDAEADLYWQWSKSRFEMVDSRGWCGDWAYFKRPDIPELVTKAAYKDWVAQGALTLGSHGEWFSANSMPNPSPKAFVAWEAQKVTWGPERKIGGANDAWTTWALRAGFKVQQTPFPGAIMVYSNHLRYVESVEPATYDDPHGAFTYSEMNALDPKKVARGSEAVDLSHYQSAHIWFVG